jgi:hypothetical protein
MPSNLNTNQRARSILGAVVKALPKPHENGNGKFKHIELANKRLKTFTKKEI